VILRPMRGLLADLNVQGHLGYLRHLLEGLGLWTVLDAIGIELVTFAHLQWPVDLNDRALWTQCQHDGWILLTDNRNADDRDSLQATLVDSWQPGKLPVLTLSSKTKFERSAEYRERVAVDVAELLFGIVQGEYRDRDRIFVPR
jgi:hypothetical protein